MRSGAALAALILLTACGGDARSEAELLAALRTAATVERPALVRELRSRTAIDSWIELLGDADFAMHSLAASELAALGAEAQPAVPTLVKFLVTGSPGKKYDAHMPVAQQLRTEDLGRKPARQALVAIGAPAVAAIREVLKNSAPVARIAGVLTLGGIGAAAKPAVDDLCGMLDDKNLAVAVWSIWAIARTGHIDDTVVSRLIAALGDRREPLIRDRALRTLISFGDPAATTARPAIEKMVEDPDAGVRALVQESLALFRQADQAKAAAKAAAESQPQASQSADSRPSRPVEPNK